MNVLHSQLAELFGHPPFSSSSEVVYDFRSTHCLCCGFCANVRRLNRHTRVVVIGKKAEVVSRVLFFLSYFIRCTELSARHEHAEAQCPPLQVRIQHTLPVLSYLSPSHAGSTEALG